MDDDVRKLIGNIIGTLAQMEADDNDDELAELIRQARIIVMSRRVRTLYRSAKLDEIFEAADAIERLIDDPPDADQIEAALKAIFD